MRKILIVISGLCLTACATPYQPMNALGGVAATQITNDTAQITARGNAYTDPDAIQRYALRKAAQTTLDAGFDTFEIVTNDDRSVHGASTGVYAGNGYAFGSTWQKIKPGETFLIKMRKGPLPENAPANMYDAHDVANHLGSDATSDNRKCSKVDGVIKCV